MTMNGDQGGIIFRMYMEDHQLKYATERRKHRNAYKLCRKTAYYTCLICGFNLHPISNRGQESGHILFFYNHKNALFGISPCN